MGESRNRMEAGKESKSKNTTLPASVAWFINIGANPAVGFVGMREDVLHVGVNNIS